MRPLAFALLIVMSAFGSLVFGSSGCGDGCNDGTRLVCNEHGEKCQCRLECVQHVDCPPLEFCSTSAADVCLPCPALPTGEVVDCRNPNP